MPIKPNRTGLNLSISVTEALCMLFLLSTFNMAHVTLRFVSLLTAGSGAESGKRSGTRTHKINKQTHTLMVVSTNCNRG